MTYTEVYETIINKRRFGKAYGRDVTEEMMELLHHPEAGQSIIHIAGTNGKGSVAAFVSASLQAASFHVGTFTSPHLVRFTERIKVDGVEISEADVARIGSSLLELDMKLEPTMFDYCLGIAMVYFKEQGVDYIVLETGLGGAKDSTSGLSVVPVVSVITSIGLEHTQILGDTIEQIAAEKAGIIKPGTKVVVGQIDDAAQKVIAQVAEREGCEVTYATVLDDSFKLGLFGEYQRKNGAVAYETLKLLGLSDDVIRQGLSLAKWPGRMEIISQEPFILADGAHNPEGVRALKDSLQKAFPDERFTFIFGVLADKDYEAMLEELLPLAARFYTLTVDCSRALESESIASLIVDKGTEAEACESIKEALAKAKAYSDKIIIAGSLYFIGSVKAYYSSVEDL